MRASAIEFRLRMAIMAVIISVGAWSPWIDATGSARRISLLEWLPLELSRTGLASFTFATPLVIVLASLIAALGATLRVWGAAYLGPGTVNSMGMKAGAVMADGPFRYVRNPLYIGSVFMVAAITFILPPSGALFVVVLLAVFLLRLIVAEEAFLTRQLGEPYQAYMRAVPRLIPRLRTILPATGLKPHWLLAVLSELTAIGVFITLAFLSWRYDNQLMTQAILISFGASLVVRALMPRASSTTTAAE